MTIKTYHYHSIFWWGWQGLASGRFTFGHTIESSIVTCNLRNITFQFVIVITFNGNVFSMHYGVPIASVVYDRNQSPISIVPSMWFWSVSWSTNCPVYFSLFLVDQKKICSVSGNFWSGSDFFGPPSFFLVYQNFFLVYQKIRAWPKKIQRLNKNSLRLNKFFLVDQKKWETDRTIGRPRDWPKPHGRD